MKDMCPGLEAMKLDSQPLAAVGLPAVAGLPIVRPRALRVFHDASALGTVMLACWGISGSLNPRTVCTELALMMARSAGFATTVLLNAMGMNVIELDTFGVGANPQL